MNDRLLMPKACILGRKCCQRCGRAFYAKLKPYPYQGKPYCVKCFEHLRWVASYKRYVNGVDLRRRKSHRRAG